MAILRAQIVVARTGPQADDVVVNTMHFLTTQPQPETLVEQAEELRDLIGTWWNTGFGAGVGLKSRVFSGYRLEDVKVYDASVKGAPLARFESGDPALTAGGASGELLPPQVACSVTFKTIERLRWGRIYLPGVTGSQCQNGRFTAQHCEAVVRQAAEFAQAAHDAGYALVVFDVLNKTWRVVREVQVDDIPDVIRRRRWEVPSIRDVRELDVDQTIGSGGGPL